MHLLEPACEAGLTRPTDEQLLRKCLGFSTARLQSATLLMVGVDRCFKNTSHILRSFTISSKSRVGSSINVIAGAQKQFYVTKAVSGVGDWVRKILDLKALLAETLF